MNIPVYFNYKCRKCGNYVSQLVTDKTEFIARSNQRGVYSSNKSSFHPNCPEMIDQEEHIYFDLISWSNEPIGEVCNPSEIRKEQEDSNAGDDRKV